MRMLGNIGSRKGCQTKFPATEIQCNIYSPFIPKGYKGWKFHRSLHCPGCFFKHQCFRCGQSHHIAKCLQPKHQHGQRTKPSISPVRSTPNTSQSWMTGLLFRSIQWKLYEELISGFLQCFRLHFHGPQIATFPLTFFLQHSIQKLVKVN